MLALEKLLIETDNDQPVVATVTVGFDDKSSLVIRLERTDYEQPARSFVKSAQISREDAYRLAKGLKVSLVELPALLNARFGVDFTADLHTPAEASAIFHELLAFVSSFGIKYQMM